MKNTKNKNEDIVVLENEIKLIFKLKRCTIDFIPNSYNFVVSIKISNRVKDSKRKEIENYIYSTISGIDDVRFNNEIF